MARLVLVLALAVIADCSRAPSTAEHAPIDTESIVRAIVGPRPDAAPVIAQVRAARDAASGPERALLERSLELVEAGQNDAEWIPKHFPEFLQLMRDISATYPKDAAAQRQVDAKVDLV